MRQFDRSVNGGPELSSLPPASAVEVIESVQSFCMSVCLFVNTLSLTAGPFDL